MTLQNSSGEQKFQSCRSQNAIDFPNSAAFLITEDLSDTSNHIKQTELEQARNKECDAVETCQRNRENEVNTGQDKG